MKSLLATASNISCCGSGSDAISHKDDYQHSLYLCLPHDCHLQGDVPVQHLQDKLAVQRTVQSGIERFAGVHTQDPGIVTPNSGTPYSMLQPTCAPDCVLRARRGQGPLLLGAVDRLVHLHLRLRGQLHHR